MTDVRARYAEALREHCWRAFDMSRDVCTGCDWRGKGHDAHTDHLANVLSALDGIAVVELPEPDGMRWQVSAHEDFAVFIEKLLRESDNTFVNGVQIAWEGLELNLCIGDAHALAAALLAAADAAEAGQ